uniref:Uncharacterized protein n=1 Tax=viral metagenome TaxID=1070528 RepID=A0A6C0F0B6_9ZZZZ
MSSNGTNGTNVNNLNIFTFIKDIYQSLKHIDQCFNNFNTVIGTRLTKLEDNQQILIDKLSGIEILLSKMGETNKTNAMLDKNIEYELLEKMKIMNNLNINGGNDRVDLKPDELTFANILENGYNLLDINESLAKYELDNDSTVDMTSSSSSSGSSTGLFSSSSGSSYYSGSGSGSNNKSNLDKLLF